MIKCLNMSTPFEAIFGETFGDKVKLLRHKYGMDQKDLAKLIFTSRFVISAIENGKKIPTLEEQKLIAEAFGVDQEFLMNTSMHDLETKQLLSHSKVLSPETLHKVNDLMEVIVEGKK